MSEVSFVQIKKVGREQTGILYGCLQGCHALMQHAKEEELAEYGRRLYDVCEDSYQSIGAIVNGRCVAILISMPYADIPKFKSEGLSDIAHAHWDFCKWLMKKPVDAVLKNDAKSGFNVNKLVYDVFGGVLPNYEGTGIFDNVVSQSRSRCAPDHRFTGFTLSETIISKSVKTNPVLGSNLIRDTATKMLVSLPPFLLAVIANNDPSLRDVSLTPIYASSFKWRGKYIYPRTVVWVIIGSQDSKLVTKKVRPVAKL